MILVTMTNLGEAEGGGEVGGSFAKKGEMHIIATDICLCCKSSQRDPTALIGCLHREMASSLMNQLWLH